MSKEKTEKSEGMAELSDEALEGAAGGALPIRSRKKKQKRNRLDPESRGSGFPDVTKTPTAPSSIPTPYPSLSGKR